LTGVGQVVCDPYMGSGTVAVVARDYKRHFLGAENEARYHTVAVRRLHGEPDASGGFPNLKTLRDYVERTSAPIERFHFDVQVGSRPSDRSQAKIYPEEHHLQAVAARLGYEEAAFAARLRGEPPPRDPTLNGTGKRTPLATTLPMPLFNEAESR